MGGKEDSDRSAYRKGPSEFEKKGGAGPDFQPEFVSDHRNNINTTVYKNTCI